MSPDDRLTRPSRAGESVESGYFAAEEPGRKGEILDAALQVFGERGYDGGSMREIASRVGVSEPALYRHFDGKEAIFLALMRVGAGRVRTETIAALDEIRADGLREQMLATLRERRQAVRFFGPLLRIILPAAARNERLLAEYRATIIFPVREKLVEKSAEIDAAFDVPQASETRDERVRALLSLVVGYMISSFVLADEPDEAIVDAALRVMCWSERA